MRVINEHKIALLEIGYAKATEHSKLAIKRVPNLRFAFGFSQVARSFKRQVTSLTLDPKHVYLFIEGVLAPATPYSILHTKVGATSNRPNAKT